jgi:hypothetical protein
MGYDRFNKKFSPPGPRPALVVIEHITLVAAQSARAFAIKIVIPKIITSVSASCKKMSFDSEILAAESQHQGSHRGHCIDDAARSRASTNSAADAAPERRTARHPPASGRAFDVGKTTHC